MSAVAPTSLSREDLRDRFVGISTLLRTHIQELLPRELSRVIAPEDVLQETFIKALKYKDSFRWDDMADFIRLAGTKRPTSPERGCRHTTAAGRALHARQHANFLRGGALSGACAYRCGPAYPGRNTGDKDRPWFADAAAAQGSGRSDARIICVHLYSGCNWGRARALASPTRPQGRDAFAPRSAIGSGTPTGAAGS